MAKKVEHLNNVTVDGGLVNGTVVVHHGSLKHTKETTGLEVKWTCVFENVDLNDLVQEAARNISVRMANIRELPYEELVEKRASLDGSRVNYLDIPTWTTKGQKGRVKFEDLSGEQMLAKMTPKQLAELRELMKAMEAGK
jgi:hypothetical protein